MIDKVGDNLFSEQIPNPLRKRAFLTPNRPAIKFLDREYTFEDLYEMAYVTAGRLKGKGVKNGQMVAVLLRNHIDTVIILLSLQLLGIKAVLLNNRLTAKEMMWQLADSQSSLLISEESFTGKLEDLKGKDDSLSITKKEELSKIPFIRPDIQEEVKLDDVCSVMYTSGTTGHPKGVLQTYGNHWWSAVGSAINLGLHEDDCWLCTLPLYHISGYSILMRSIFYGMKMVLHETFDAKKVIQDIKSENVTIMSVVTTTLSRLLQSLENGKLPSHFRCMLLGGGPAPLPFLEKCVEKDIPVYQSYGMTETSSQIVTLSPEYSLQKLGSAGKPLFPSQLRIVDSRGNIAKPMESGEIVVKGPNVTIGYLSGETINFKDGWFYTGDIGYLDQEGFLYVQDRRSDLIISGGENIYPAEVEGVLISHPSVSDAGVIGKKNETWGEVPVAFIVSTAELDEKELKDYCARYLAKYKVPKTIYFVEKLPRNASRKLLRRKLRQWMENLEDATP